MMEHMDASLHDLITRTFATVEAKDLDAMMSVFADDAVVIDPHFPMPQMQGKAAITEGFRGAITGMRSFGYTIVNYFESKNGQRAAVSHISRKEYSNIGANIVLLVPINTSQQQPAPQFFTPALQEPDSPHWGTGEITSYGMLVQQQPYTPLPIQPSYTPLPVQPSYKLSPVQPSYMPLPVQSSYAPSSVQLPFTPLPMQPPYTPSQVQPKPSNRLKVLLIIVSLILLLGVAGGGIAAYFLTRPQPVMSVTSAYNVASIPTGSTGTALHVNAHSFSGSSVITFLLDNVPVASSQKVNSDANGNVSADLTVTNAWTVGKHSLTAKDASGYATKAGVTVSIVPQGQAHTPGPNGAPTDDMSFTLKANVQVQDAGTGQQLASNTETLTVLGKPDPSGGTVCQAIDDGQTHIYNGTTSNGTTYRETFVLACTGIYKGGKLTYTETATSYKADFSNGLSCMAHTPYILQHLEGSFTSPNTISGTFSGDSVTLDCNQGIGTQQANASKGSWTAQM